MSLIIHSLFHHILQNHIATYKQLPFPVWRVASMYWICHKYVPQMFVGYRIFNISKATLYIIEICCWFIS